MTRICLNMMVKNEAARIERCLASVAPHISTYAVLDTGSSDGTDMMVRDILGARGLEGSVGHGEFTTYGDTRNRALELAHNLNLNGHPWDYLLLCDADMELVAPDGLGELTAPGYQVIQRSGGLEYWNARLLRRDNTARYVGATHEYLDTAQPMERLHGPYFIDHADGANRPGKVLRDVALLEAAVLRDPTDARSWFYLAQSLRELGHFKQAEEAYRKRGELGGWDEEVFYSWLQLSRVQRAQNGFEGTHTALEAWDRRPSRLEPLADLSRHYRELGLNEVAVMFALRGIEIEPPKDLLFVETDALAQLREDLSICAFYCSDPEIRKRGREVCDREALRRIPEGVASAQADGIRARRDLARQNLHFYLEEIGTVFPSWRSRRLTFTPPDGYRQMAPSVTRLGERIFAAQRCINYWIDEGGYNTPGSTPETRCPVPVHTRTLLLEIDPDTLAESVHGEILLPADFPPALPGAWVRGFEDMRLFSWCGELWGLSTVRERAADNAAEQWLARIGSSLRMVDPRPIFPEGPRRHEKNWMPLVDGYDLRFIYLCDPARIIDQEGHTVAESIPEIAADHFRGGSQAIPFVGGWLAVIHWVQWFDGWPKYRHRFAWFDDEYSLKRVSPGWVFPSTATPELLRGYQYVTGLCWHPNGRRLIMGFQVDEREAWIGTMDATEVAAALDLKEAIPYKPPRPLGPPLSPADKSEPPIKIGGSLFDDERWVLSQTNRALQETAAVDRATRMLNELGLPEHRDRIKNWDTAIALWHAFGKCHPEGPVLDAGGDRNAAFLPGLARLGFKRLVSLNLEERKPAFENGVSYSWGDITRTGMPAGFYHFIACLSVLEHGVPIPRFLDEMARVIAPGGHLFISVDYWEVPVSTDHVTFLGSYAGQTWKIFTPAEIHELVSYAQSLGLTVVGDMDFRCRNRVAHHLGCDFTFLNLLFRQ